MSTDVFHYKSAITSIIFIVIYGKRIPTMDHEYVIAAQRAVEGVTTGTIPGRYWVEYLPILQYIPSWFPGANFKKVAAEYVPYVIASSVKPYNEVKEAIVRTTLDNHIH